MDKTLIVKLGALGDVLRTTSILNVLDGDITWFTEEVAKPLLENIPKISSLTSDINDIAGKKFDVVMNLDDDLKGCKVVDNVYFSKLYGFYAEGGKVLPMPESKEWWEMSLNGSYDRDYRKQMNRKTFQEHLFRNIGRRFNGEDYVFGYNPKNISGKVVGLEARAGDRWPMKVWPFYSSLKEKLESENIEVKVFEQKGDIREYIDDINSCRVVVSGDSLAMHAALALKKKVVAIFGPTNPYEIEMYGRGKKLYADMSCIFCFKKTLCDKSPNCMQSISVNQVYSAVRGLLNE